ncbi:hypothetical protein [Corynebacterium sp.]
MATSWVCAAARIGGSCSMEVAIAVELAETTAHCSAIVDIPA